MRTQPDLTGIDGCAGGWVAAHLTSGTITWASEPIDHFSALVGKTTAVDIPIGLVDAGWRECDLEAKAAMGRHGSRIFLTPPRAVLMLADAPNDVAQEASVRLTGQGVSRQALALAPRILTVDAYVTAEPSASVHESFPELAFMRLAHSDQPLESKKTGRGVGQRVAALARWRADIAEVVAQAPPGIAIDDCLDALACLWSATRIAAQTCEVLPSGATSTPSIRF